MTLSQPGAAVPQDAECRTDAQLLECFLARRDQEAFADLVRRHGPMVLGVCRRVLGHTQDAEDAFQAAFLVLARKAGSVSPPGAVGNWLYGVAYRTALKAKAVARRRGRERQVAQMPEPAAPETEQWAELWPLLDRELERLPDKYRAAVVLCDLEGHTHQEAARRLGWPEGTLSTRLSRARDLLARRLARRGLTLSATALALALSAPEATAWVPGPLVVSTARAAPFFAVGPAAGTVPAGVSALAEGVLRAMLFVKLRIVLTVLLALGVLGLGAGALAHGTLGADEPKEGTAKTDLDRLQGTWEMVSMEAGGQQAPKKEVAGTTLVIKGDKGTMNHAPGRSQDCVLKLKPGKNPREIDMAVDDNGKEDLHLGIYKIEGDTLTLCMSHPPADRPAAFATREGSKWPVLFVLKKQAAKPK